MHLLINPMKPLYLFVYLAIFLFSCKKDDSYVHNSKYPLTFSEDTVSFDTVFTSAGSTTRRIKIFNLDKKAVVISQIKLFGGSASAYQINVNGIASHQISNFEIPARDSINLFVKVTINPNSQESPFIVKDSINFVTNGATQVINLKAYGQNAHFLNNAVINENTTWDNKLPYVISNKLLINEGKTLTVPKGSRIYFHKGGKMEVAGTLRIEGEASDTVTFASDRLERLPYAEERGQWDGIRLLRTSKDNFIKHATIKNALIGIQVDSASVNSSPKLLIVNSIVKNMEVAGILGYNTSIAGFNNLLSNCGKYLIYCPNGGFYDFKQNTLVNLNSRTTPSLFFSDSANSTGATTLDVTLINNIIWGSLQDELRVEKKGSQFKQLIRSNLVKSLDKVTLESLGNIVNSDPLFIPNSLTFSLQAGSSAENEGEDLSSDPYFNQWLSMDQHLTPRLFPSELGCYEIF